MGKVKKVYYEIPCSAIVLEKSSNVIPEHSKVIRDGEVIFTDVVHEFYYLKLAVGSQIDNIEGVKNVRLITFKVIKEDFEKIKPFDDLTIMCKMSQGSLVVQPVSITTNDGELIYHNKD